MSILAEFDCEFPTNDKTTAFPLDYVTTHGTIFAIDVVSSDVANKKCHHQNYTTRQYFDRFVTVWHLLQNLQCDQLALRCHLTLQLFNSFRIADIPGAMSTSLLLRIYLLQIEHMTLEKTMAFFGNVWLSVKNDPFHGTKANEKKCHLFYRLEVYLAFFASSSQFKG